MTIDISNFTFDEWLRFTFDHPVSFDFFWHFDDNWAYTCDRRQTILYTTMLFKNPEVLLRKFSPEQIDQGFWFIPGPNGYILYLLDNTIPLSERKQCIESIFDLFCNLYAKHYMPGISGYSWWDSVFTYCTYNERKLRDEPELLVEFYKVMIKISKNDSLYLQKSAQYGLDIISQYYELFQRNMD